MRGFRPFDSDPEPTGVEGRLAKSNRRTAFLRMVAAADSAQALTSREIADWHRQLFAGLSHVPASCYLGGYRGSEHPWLRDYEVEVKVNFYGTPARMVAEEVEAFLNELEKRLCKLAESIVAERDKTAIEVRQLATVAAWAHGEWLRLHPFANGNGRTARLIANYVLARYRIAPVVRLRPRPEPPYVDCATASMLGEVDSLAAWIIKCLEEGVITGS